MKIFKKNKYRILSSVSKYSFVFILLFTLILPTVFAANKEATTPNALQQKETITPNAELDKKASTVKVNVGIDNPLAKSGIEDIPSFLIIIIKFVLYIGIPIITLAIIYSGFLFVQAQGNAEALKKAKNAFIYTLIGAAILLGSFIITSAIQGTVGQINSANK